MSYKISGEKSETARIMVLKESDWGIESNTVISGSGAYSVEDLEAGNKLVVGRKSDGQVISYGNITPEYYISIDPDTGITWTSRTSAADNSWQSVCWSPELTLFVAIANTGAGNRVMTSL